MKIIGKQTPPVANVEVTRKIPSALLNFFHFYLSLWSALSLGRKGRKRMAFKMVCKRYCSFYLSLFISISRLAIRNKSSFLMLKLVLLTACEFSTWRWFSLSASRETVIWPVSAALIGRWQWRVRLPDTGDCPPKLDACSWIFASTTCLEIFDCKFV